MNRDLKNKVILFLTMIVFIFTIQLNAQNILQIDNTQGVINDTIVVSLSINNSEEFVSFQCDIQLPDDFNYIQGSLSLSPRAVNHIINVTNPGNNIIRIFSYSPDNTPFLLDSGTIVNLQLLTPSIAGNYILELKNGIIGNAQSVNILDSMINGTIYLNSVGLQEINISGNKINCFPNPFKESLNIQLNLDQSQNIILKVFDIRGRLLSSCNRGFTLEGINDLVFNAQELFGSKPTNGIYFIQIDTQFKNKKYSIVKKIQYEK